MTVVGTRERPRQQRSWARRLPVAFGYAVPLVVAAAVTKPGWFGLSEVAGFLHLVSFPLAMGIGWFTGAALLAPVALLTRRRLVVWLLVVAVSAGSMNALTVFSRGLGGGELAAARGDASLVTFNTLGGAVAPDDLARLIVRTEAAAVALQETPASFAHQVARAAGARGRRLQVLGGEQSPFPVGATSLLVAGTWGRYRVADQPDTGLGAVVAEPVRGRGPTIAAVHSPPPLVPPTVLGRPPAWRTGAWRAVDLCRTGAADLVLGDVNATVDHAPLARLGPCADAAVATGGGAEGTWPARLPTAVAVPVDHVFVDERSWRPVDTGVVRLGHSDHRVLVAQVREV